MVFLTVCLGYELVAVGYIHKKSQLNLPYACVQLQPVPVMELARLEQVSKVDCHSKARGSVVPADVEGRCVAPPLWFPYSNR